MRCAMLHNMVPPVGKTIVFRLRSYFIPVSSMLSLMGLDKIEEWSELKEVGPALAHVNYN